VTNEDKSASFCLYYWVPLNSI